MKYYETTCAEYIAASKLLDVHPELAPLSESMPTELNKLGNMVFYGPSGTGKYTQFLRFIERYATVGLKTEKMTASTEKQKYEYHISDIHYEIDMALLGCESKKLWNECFFQIVDVISAKWSKSGIILCKNFQSIHSELLDVFYSYMQHCRTLPIHIVFVILTEHVSFIPNRILQCCKLIHVKRPSAELYSKMGSGYESSTQPKSHKYFMKRISPDPVVCQTTFDDDQFPIEDHSITGESGTEKQEPYIGSSDPERILQQNKKEIIPEYLLNMKEVHSIAKLASPPKDVFNIVCDNIIAKMTPRENLNIISLRENLYDILLYGLDVSECLWYIIHYLVENEILVDETGGVISQIMDKINSFLKFYNNNYRPIYHLESMFIYLITKIYKYPSSSNEPNTST